MFSRTCGRLLCSSRNYSWSSRKRKRRSRRWCSTRRNGLFGRSGSRVGAAPTFSRIRTWSWRRRYDDRMRRDTDAWWIGCGSRSRRNHGWRHWRRRTREWRQLDTALKDTARGFPMRAMGRAARITIRPTRNSCYNLGENWEITMDWNLELLIEKSCFLRRKWLW